MAERTAAEIAALRRIGKNIKIARVESDHMPQDELARRAGLQRSHLSGIEMGRHNPSAAILLRIATALDVSPAQLWQGVGEE